MPHDYYAWLHSEKARVRRNEEEGSLSREEAMAWERLAEIQKGAGYGTSSA